MRKIILLIIAIFCFANDELLLESANAYKIVLKNNKVPQQMAEKSSAIIIFPNFIRAGLFVGGGIGTGVMIDKNFIPKSVKISGVNLGIQAGYSDTSLVIYIINPDVVQDILDSKFMISGDVSARFMENDAKLESISDFKFSDDLYAYSSSVGIFAGVKADTLMISPDDNKFDLNSYGYNELVNSIQNSN